jgi:hypothetical protein
MAPQVGLESPAKRSLMHLERGRWHLTRLIPQNPALAAREWHGRRANVTCQFVPDRGKSSRLHESRGAIKRTAGAQREASRIFSRRRSGISPFDGRRIERGHRGYQRDNRSPQEILDASNALPGHSLIFRLLTTISVKACKIVSLY